MLISRSWAGDKPLPDQDGGGTVEPSTLAIFGQRVSKERQRCEA